MPRARCVDPEPSHEIETVGEAAAGRLYRLRAALGARLPERAKPSHAMVHPADPSPPSLGAHAVRSHWRSHGWGESVTRPLKACTRSGCSIELVGDRKPGGLKVKTQTKPRPCAKFPSASNFFLEPGWWR